MDGNERAALEGGDLVDQLAIHVHVQQRQIRGGRLERCDGGGYP